MWNTFDNLPLLIRKLTDERRNPKNTSSKNNGSGTEVSKPERDNNQEWDNVTYKMMATSTSWKTQRNLHVPRKRTAVVFVPWKYFKINFTSVLWISTARSNFIVVNLPWLIFFVDFWNTKLLFVSRSFCKSIFNG